MASTGEVGCLGHELNEAFLKAFLSVGFKIPEKNILLSTGPLESKGKFLKSALKLKQMGYTLYTSPGSGRFLRDNGVEVEILNWPLDNKHPNIANYLSEGKIDLVINIPKNNLKEELKNDYTIRRMAVDFEIPLITNLQVAVQLVDALEYYKKNSLEILAWDEY
jgi:carbamoyl-phosphate synthase large subunit